MRNPSPISGPISPDELRRIAELPYGKAAEELRKHDPAWGLATQDNPHIKWTVTVTAMRPVYTEIEVEAPDEAAAKKLALREADGVGRYDWEDDDTYSVEDIRVESVEPFRK